MNRIVLVTLISAFLFCSLLVTSSLSPLSKTGPNAIEFNSFGLWLDIGIILLCYTLPLIAYIKGVYAMKYLMATFSWFGILLTFLIVIVVLSTPVGKPSDFIGVIVICIASLITNIIWFAIAFSLSRNFHKAS